MSGQSSVDEALQLRVVKGEVDDDELAALLAGLIARAGTSAPTPAQATVNRWADPVRSVRGASSVTPRGWRWSYLANN